MSEFETVGKKKREKNAKRDIQQKAIEMASVGFSLPKAIEALEARGGDVTAAGVRLLKDINKSLHVKPIRNEFEEVELHYVVMSTYKVHRCRDMSTHDISKCMYWHTDKDRRRNPFAMHYASADCPYLEKNEECPAGPETCKFVHSKLEKMFHPEVYKRIACQQGSTCSRGVFCAFFQGEDDCRGDMIVSRRAQNAKETINDTKTNNSTNTSTNKTTDINNNAHPAKGTSSSGNTQRSYPSPSLSASPSPSIPLPTIASIIPTHPNNSSSSNKKNNKNPISQKKKGSEDASESHHTPPAEVNTCCDTPPLSDSLISQTISDSSNTPPTTISSTSTPIKNDDVTDAYTTPLTSSSFTLSSSTATLPSSSGLTVSSSITTPISRPRGPSVKASNESLEVTVGMHTPSSYDINHHNYHYNYNSSNSSNNSNSGNFPGISSFPYLGAGPGASAGSDEAFGSPIFLNDTNAQPQTYPQQQRQPPHHPESQHYHQHQQPQQQQQPHSQPPPPPPPPTTQQRGLGRGFPSFPGSVSGGMGGLDFNKTGGFFQDIPGLAAGGQGLGLGSGHGLALGLGVGLQTGIGADGGNGIGIGTGHGHGMETGFGVGIGVGGRPPQLDHTEGGRDTPPGYITPAYPSLIHPPPPPPNHLPTHPTPYHSPHGVATHPSDHRSNNAHPHVMNTPLTHSTTSNNNPNSHPGSTVLTPRSNAHHQSSHATPSHFTPSEFSGMTPPHPGSLGLSSRSSNHSDHAPIGSSTTMSMSTHPVHAITSGGINISGIGNGTSSSSPFSTPNRHSTTIECTSHTNNHSNNTHSSTPIPPAATTPTPSSNPAMLSLQTQVSSLQRDLANKTRDCELQRIEINEYQQRALQLKEQHHTEQQHHAKAISDLSTELTRLREQLANSQSTRSTPLAMELKQTQQELTKAQQEVSKYQQLARANSTLCAQKEAEIEYLKGVLQEREAQDHRQANSPLNRILRDPETNLAASKFFGGSSETLRAKLSSVESDYDTRSIKMTFRM